VAKTNAISNPNHFCKEAHRFTRKLDSPTRVLGEESHYEEVGTLLRLLYLEREVTKHTRDASDAKQRSAKIMRTRIGVHPIERSADGRTARGRHIGRRGGRADGRSNRRTVGQAGGQVDRMKADGLDSFSSGNGETPWILFNL
jgi:hypothetical protein